jgi:4-hydroxybenzoate polyprenyltransferase
MGNIRDWLQLFRSHTSPLEMSITTAGAALAVGGIFDVRVLMFLVFGWLYHNAGYGHNSAEDFIQGYDRDDPNKAHHPLQRGVIAPSTARSVTITMVVIGLIFGAVISRFDPWALAVLFIMTIMGFLYNLFNKRTRLKFVPIALAHALLFPFSFLGAGGGITLSGLDVAMEGTGGIALVTTLLIIVQILYQILIEGDLKDIEMSEASMLRSMGVKVINGRLVTPLAPRAISFALKLASCTLLFLIYHLSGGDPFGYAIIGLFSLSLLIMDQSLMGSKPYDHSASLRNMAVMEVISTFAIVAALAPKIGGWTSALLVMVLNILYFVLMNRFLWGTLIKPRV